MSVTNYTPGSDSCKYRYDRLKDVIYLVSNSHTKNVHIDNGAAYIEDLSYSPIALRGFNIQFNEYTSLDERYKFTKSVTMSMRGYVTPEYFGDRYYVILESEDGTYWMVNTDFPVKVTYTFNLNSQQNQTDFTFSLNSNFPTLQLITDAIDPLEYHCIGLNVPGIESLKLLENAYTNIDTETKTIYTYGKEFQDIEFLSNSCSFQESFDGEKVTTTIQFNIGFDAYKSSWHYNLLEFTENLYAAIITPKNNDNNYFAGFNFGLQPGFTVKTSEGQSDIITITLVEMSNHGSTSAEDYTHDDDDTKYWVYIRNVGDIKGYECVAPGIARFLLQQEVNRLGYPTGNYKCFTGYEEHFRSLGLNIVGIFDQEYRFSNPDCSDSDDCTITTTIPNTIVYTGVTCNTYSISSTCPWEIDNLPTYITVSPSAGDANSMYTVTVCNTKEVTEEEFGSFNIIAGNNTRVVNVRLTTDSGGFIQPTSHTINCLSQDVVFTFDPNCPITVTSIAPALAYSIQNSRLVVTVPRNYGTSSITWSITVKDCNNSTQTVYIYQDKTYEVWNVVAGYICVGSDSYTKERRYTGTTSSNLVATDEYRAGTLIQSGDTRCQNYQTKWEWDNESYYCIEGRKFKVIFEWIKYGDGEWTKTGVTRLGDSVEDTDNFCDQAVTYSWVLSTKWQCGGEATQFKLRATYPNEVVVVPCDSTSSITYSNITSHSSITEAFIGDCVTTIDNLAFYTCSAMTSITIGSNVTTINEGALAHCYALTSITIPDSVTSIGYAAFGVDTGLTSIMCLATTPPTLGSVAFDYTNDCPIYVPAESVDTYKSASGWSDYASRIQAIT